MPMESPSHNTPTPEAPESVSTPPAKKHRLSPAQKAFLRGERAVSAPATILVLVIYALLLLSRLIDSAFLSRESEYLSIILPGRMYKEAFEDRRLKGKNLSRCLEDSGTLTSNFFPWNTCGATMRTFLQVGSGYIPYAVLNWINPVISLFYGFTGIGMTKMTDDEYAAILEAREADREAALKALEA